MIRLSVGEASARQRHVSLKVIPKAYHDLDLVSNDCHALLVEVFAFFDPAHVNIIGGPWCVHKQHHVGASHQEHANRLVDVLSL